MNKKLIQVAEAMERNARRQLRAARKLREMAAQDGGSRGKEIAAFEAIKELRTIGIKSIH